MNRWAVIGIALLVGSCGASRSAHVNDRGPVMADADAVCTPYVSHDPARDRWTVRTVCEVDDEILAAFQPVRSRRPRAYAGGHYGFPDDRVQESKIDPRAEEAATQVQILLSHPDPMGAGYLGVEQILDHLPISVLLDTFDLLEQRGLIDVLAPDRRLEALQGGQRRYLKALYIREVSRLADRHVTGEIISQVAVVLDGFHRKERDILYRYIMEQRGVPADVARLVEGLTALENARVQWREPVVVTAAGSATPSPIKPGPWTKKPKEPGRLYIGREAHDAIGKYYERANRGDTVILNHTPMSTILETLKTRGHETKPHLLSDKQLPRRPDILNISKMHIYEIKPMNRVVEAEAVVNLYVGILKTADVVVTLGPSDAPGTKGITSAPAGLFLFFSPRPGVITYQYTRGVLAPVPILDDVLGKVTKWDWKVKFSRGLKLSGRLVVAMAATTVVVLTALAMVPASS